MLQFRKVGTLRPTEWSGLQGLGARGPPFKNHLIPGRVNAGRVWSASRHVAEDLSTKEEAPLGNHSLSGLQTTQHRVVFANRRTEPDLPLNELAVFADSRDEDDLPIPDGLDGRAWHDHRAATRSRETHGHVHAQPEPAIGVRHLDSSLGRAG